MTPTDNIHLLAAPYAMDALDDLERVRFEAHLSDCAHCTTEVGEFLETVGMLGAAEVQPVTSEFRSSVLADIDGVRQVGPLRAPVPRIAPRFLSVAAGVLALAVISLSIVVTSQQTRIGELEPYEQLAFVLEQPDAITFDVTSGEAALHVIASPDSGAGVIVAAGMDAAPNGHAYQLWLITDAGEALSAGFLDIDSDGTGQQLMQGEMDGVVAIGITVEPAGGSEAPTSDPAMVIPLTA